MFLTVFAGGEYAKARDIRPEEGHEGNREVAEEDQLFSRIHEGTVGRDS